MKTPHEIYRYHVKNEQRVGKTLDRIGSIVRSSIAKSDETSQASFLSLYMLLLAVWAECRLKKLLYEEHAFGNDEREAVGLVTSQFNKWQKVVEIGFRKHYGIPHADLSQNLPFSPRAKYLELNNLLMNELKAVIEIRNKLAHGQWEYIFNDDGNDILTALMGTLRTENLFSLQHKRSLLSFLVSIIHDLTVSAPTFERDFDKHYRHITEIKRELKNKSYKDFAEFLIKRRENGIKKRMIGKA